MEFSRFGLLLNKNKVAVASVIPIIGFVVSWVLNSRSFCFGFLIATWLIIAKHAPGYGQFVLKSGVLIVLFFIFLVFFVKVDSSLGRLFIYKICFKIWCDHWLPGIGTGRFKEVYIHYQANYFASGRYTLKELLLADNTRYAFNDYVELAIENGVVGLILIFVYFYFIARSIVSFFRSADSVLFDTALLIGVILSIAALFTHIYDKPLFLIILLIAFFIVFDFQYRHIYNRYVRFFIAILLIAVFFLSNNTNKFIEYKAYRSFEQGVELVNSGFRREAIDTLRLIYPALKNDGVYLAFYGSQLLDSQYIKEAYEMLNQAVKLCPSSDKYVDLANCYFILGNYPKAEESFVTAINMVPNRFRSRYCLYNFYKYRYQFKKAFAVGTDILRLPVKIPSPIISSIKSNVKIDLNKCPIKCFK